MGVKALRVDHIGVAVEKIAGALAIYRDGLGLGAAGEDTVESEGVKIAFLEVGESKIELLEPLGETSNIAKHLAKRGPGVHHVCIEVEDLGEALKTLAASGGEVIPPAPRTGAHGRKVAFVHPKSTGGVLIELAEVRRQGGGGTGVGHDS